MAAPSPAAPQQRGKDARVGVHARRYVGDGDARFGRRLGRARDGDEGGLALDEQVVGLFVAVRARGAVAGDVAHDEPGWRSRNDSVPKPRRPVAPGARFWTKTSDFSRSRFRAPRAASSFRFRVSDSLERLIQTKCWKAPGRSHRKSGQSLPFRAVPP